MKLKELNLEFPKWKDNQTYLTYLLNQIGNVSRSGFLFFPKDKNQKTTELIFKEILIF